MRTTTATLALVTVMAFCASNASADSGKERERIGVAIPYPVHTIDLSFSTDPVKRIIGANVASTLLRTSSADGTTLELLDGVDIRDGGKTIALTLKPGLTFANGSPVSGESFRDALEMLREKARGNTKRAFDAVRSITVVERQTYYQSDSSPQVVVLSLDAPLDDPQQFLAGLPIVDVNVGAQAGELFGSGTLFGAVAPFFVRENRPDQGMVLERVESYYRPGYPRAAVVDFKYFETAAEALSALRVGAVDIIALPTASQLESLEDDPTLQAVASPLGRMLGGSESWKLVRPYWSDSSAEHDRLQTDKIIVRKTLKLDNRFAQNFDLTGVYLP
ncbi:MAG: hypothetical protein KDD44_01695 [Bdellovibrionales bacterium]|nr:hypothetical protein [Bdellovibrionales bacterium]